MAGLRPVGDDEKKGPNFDESGLKGELGWVAGREVLYDTMLAIRYGKTEIRRALEEPRYECLGVAVFGDRELLRIQLEAYEKEKQALIRAGRALFIREPGTPAGVAAEQYLLDKFEQLVRATRLGRMNVLKLMDKGKYEGPNRLFDFPKG